MSREEPRGAERGREEPRGAERTRCLADHGRRREPERDDVDADVLAEQHRQQASGARAERVAYKTCLGKVVDVSRAM